MSLDATILLSIAISMIVLMIAETHIAFVTLALCGGYVLSQFAATDVITQLGKFIEPGSFPLDQAVHVGLLLIPPLLLGVRSRRTQRGLKRFIQQMVPGLALALLSAVLLIDTLPEADRARLSGESYLASSLQSFAVWLVMFAIATALFDVLIKHANEPGSGEKRGPGRPKK